MVFVNTDALKSKLAEEGRQIIITHYFGEETYDSDQNPTRPSKQISTKVAVHRPNKTDLDIATGLGKVTIDDKKFRIPGDVEISNADLIKFSITDKESYKVKIVIEKETHSKKTEFIVFASIVK